VILAIADQANDDGTGMLPSSESLGVRCGMSSEKAALSVNSIIALGELEVAEDSDGFLPYIFPALAGLNYVSKWSTIHPVRRQFVNGSLRRQLRSEIDSDLHVCAQCFSRDGLVIDHIKPISCGGTNDRENMQVLCNTCNSRKGARLA
jgi:hypothetical protein